LKKLAVLSFCFLFCFAACVTPAARVNESNELYRWESLEKEIYKLVVEAEAEAPKDQYGYISVYRTIKTTDKSKIECAIEVYSGISVDINFTEDKKEFVYMIIQSLSQIHGEPLTIREPYAPLNSNPPVPEISWAWEDPPNIWYYDVSISERLWAGKGVWTEEYPYNIHILARTEDI